MRYRVYGHQLYPLAMSDMRMLDSKVSTTWCQVSCFLVCFFPLLLVTLSFWVCGFCCVCKLIKPLKKPIKNCVFSISECQIANSSAGRENRLSSLLLSPLVFRLSFQRQLVKVNTTFNAFLLPNTPQLSPEKKPLSMVRHLVLEDDTKEYWGFYLLRGTSVTVSTCVR